MLTAPEIRLLLKHLSEKTVVEPTKQFPFRITQETPGWRAAGEALDHASGRRPARRVAPR